MKWKHKGHEYDAVYEQIKTKKNIYIFGAGRDGRAVFDILTNWLAGDFHIIGFVDNDQNKQGTTYCGLPVVSCQEIDIGIPALAVVIGIVGAKVFQDIKNDLKKIGLRENQDFFHYSEFLSVYFAYAKQKLFIHNISFLPSTVCNLRCECCLNFTPYMNGFVVRALDDLKADIDLFFQVVDYVELFHVSGGEPFMYPELPQLLRYIYDHYHQRIHSLETVTNGTVMPSAELMKVYRDLPITITVDDYRESLPDKRARFDEVIQALQSIHGKGKFKIQHYDSWIDLAPTRTDHSAWPEKRLEEYFDACHCLLQEFRAGKLYLCNYDAYAETAGLIEKLPEQDMYDFHQYDSTQRKELMEFRLGYSERGYAELCKHCAGLFEINPHKVQPAKQVEE